MSLARRSPGKEHVEEVEGRLEIEAGASAHRLPGVPEGVIALAPVGIGEHLVGLSNLLEVFLCLMVPGVAVWVEAHRQTAVGALQLSRSGLPVHA